MSIAKLDIGEKTSNQGATAAGRLSADEFNELLSRVNDLIDNANKVVYCTQDEYSTLVANGEIDESTIYNIYEE